MNYENALTTLGNMLNECEKEDPDWEHMKELTQRYNVVDTADMPYKERELWRSAGTSLVVFYIRKHDLGKVSMRCFDKASDFYQKHLMERVY